MAVGIEPAKQLLPVPGIKLGVCKAGIRVANRQDLVVMELAEGCQTAAVFTQNKFCAAPVTIAKRHLAHQAPRYLLINTGNANAGTGEQGIRDTLRCCEAIAALTNAEISQILPFSTGVIGEPLPVSKIVQGLPAAIQDLDEAHWNTAASGIMTTDTIPKGISKLVTVQGVPITITGISKGAGMIRPNMATMLAYVGTDAPLSPAVLQQLLERVVERSFNRITVDSDTSTNDAALLIASHRADLAPLEDLSDPAWQDFITAVQDLFLFLAQAIVRDAEGASKFVEVKVENAATVNDALEVAYTVAHSPLVKTALFASDPNWGRILAAVGRARVERLNVDNIAIWLNDVAIVSQGGRDENYQEAAGQAEMDKDELVIRIDLGQGDVSESVWTSDLSHDYVRINAEYRT